MDFPHNSVEPFPLNGICTDAIKVKRLSSPVAEHFQDEAPRLFRGVRFQTKAPQLSYNILTRLTQPGRLMEKLQGNRAETSDLICMRKTQHFQKMHHFLTYLRVPDEGSTRDNFFRRKQRVFIDFLIFQCASSQESVQNVML